MLFLPVGLKIEFALISSVIMPSAEIVGIILFMILIKIFGRRRPLFMGCIIMCSTKVILFSLW